MIGVVVIAAYLAAATGDVTAEAINAYAAECIEARVRMDLIERFGGDFGGLDLQGVDFRGMHTVGYSTNLQGADFTGANLRGSRFGSSQLMHAVFDQADLSAASFVTADLSFATFADATFGTVSFQECTLDGVKLAGADLSAASITGSDFPGADLSGAVLRGVASEYWWTDLTAADLRGADLGGVKLCGTVLVDADLRDAILTGGDLSQANLSNADLTGAQLDGVIITAAIVETARGIEPTVHADLIERAARDAFERERLIARTLDDLKLPAYVAAVAATLAFIILAMARCDRQVWPWLLATINAIATIPPLTLIAVRLLGGSPTAQMSGGPAGLDLWSLWFHMWPIAMLGAFVLLPCAVIATLWHIVRGVHRKWPRGTSPLIMASLFTAVHAVCLLWLLSVYFPDA